jgi:hypothetical protein
MAGTKMHIDIKTLEKFTLSLTQLTEYQVRAFMEQALKQQAAILLEKAIKRTPVGDYSGDDYTAVDGRTVKGHKNPGKVGGELRHSWTVGNVTKKGHTFQIEIINPKEYAPYVEYGHRTPSHDGWVNGYFMLTASLQELQNDAPTVLMNKLNAFLNSHLLT